MQKRPGNQSVQRKIVPKRTSSTQYLHCPQKKPARREREPLGCGKYQCELRVFKRDSDRCSNLSSGLFLLDKIALRIFLSLR